MEFKNFICANTDGQMISDFIGTDVKGRWDMLQSVVSSFATGVLFENEILSKLIVIARFVHADHHIVNAHEKPEKNVKPGRHHTLQ